MNVEVFLFARLRREAGRETLPLELPAGATVREAALEVERQCGLSLRGCMAAVNERYASPQQPLSNGDQLAFLPPVAGGSHDDVWCVLTPEPLGLEAARALLTRPEWGAQAFFSGTVRSPNRGEEVLYLEYEAYAPMALKVMQECAEAAREKYGTLGVYIAHRTGRLYPGEVSIVVGTGSPHRRAALEACDLLIERLKAELPVWKLERTAAGESWVEGQTGAETL
ncbi:molybdopterin synthase catalytic subunit [Deinobacterium chartae]|uniref:Molybdopterin synthase catalytic subunit n=1 Tax=Deinobacterium chartae TaxID=521158 RepID=A0A841I5Y5_9DEIO|nr:molybdenum cofactor biosynthesis protein MoaE [Deinobacterium chartae]MBB6099332.1 molybdopterin synthase catalytic subunit [Deinobacterium chartae]